MREELFVAGGFAEVRQNTLRVVTEASERPTEIDVERAEQAAERARERLRDARPRTAPTRSMPCAPRLALRRAMMRLKTGRRRR